MLSLYSTELFTQDYYEKETKKEVPEGEIEITRYGPFTYSFRHDGKSLTNKDLREVAKYTPDALKHFKRAQRNLYIALFFDSIGAVGVVLPLYVAGPNNQFLLGPFAAGLTLLAASVPLYFSMGIINKKGAKKYNQIQRQQGRTSFQQPQLDFGLTASGVGLQLRF